jgi:hypothetical protein
MERRSEDRQSADSRKYAKKPKFNVLQFNISLQSGFISNTRAERISLISNPQGKTIN